MAGGVTYFHTNLLIHALLPLFYLLLQLLDGGAIRSSAVGLEDLDIPTDSVNMMPSWYVVVVSGTDSSERGVIFFSSISSSA